MGDMVYYKQVDSTEWKGPGVVIGQDRVVTFVRHGGTYVHVHQSRLLKVFMLRERENRLMGTENATLLNTGVYENNTENESEEEAPSNDEDAEDNNYNTSTHSNTTCEGLKQKTGQVVTYTDSENGQVHTGKILSRAGKVTGTYKNWYNLQYTEDK